jgi:hypothetical protein
VFGQSLPSLGDDPVDDAIERRAGGQEAAITRRREEGKLPVSQTPAL